MGYLIFDIETVPDAALWSPPQEENEPERLELEKAPTKDAKAFLELVMKVLGENERPVNIKDIEKAYKTAAKMKMYEEAATTLKMILDEHEAANPPRAPFPPSYAHRPISVGFMQLDDGLNVTGFGAAGTLTHGDDEERLLRDFGMFASMGDPTLVGWNSKAFDMPVILHRSMRLGVPHSWYDKNKRYRYDESAHIDLKQALTEYGLITATRPNYSLDKFARVIGLPGKMGVDGSQVADLYQEGKHQDIASYCQDDVAQTAFILLRFLMLRGRLRREKYTEVAEQMLLAWNAARSEPAPVDEATLLLR